MADVAHLAGVSGQTVSRVANDSPRVDPATRDRVRAAMAQLGYRPHRAARALRTGRTQTLGLMVSTLASVGNSRMLQAVADAAAVRGYALVVVTVTAAGDLQGAFARLRDQEVDGAVILNEATALTAATELPDDIPLLIVDAAGSAGRHATLHTDHAGGAAAAVRHLLELGHPTVHHLAGPAGSFAAAERERGWREALAAASVPAPPVLRGDWTAASGHIATLALPPQATALFAANDQMALGALRALAGEGRDVPGAVSVVGFDDIADAADFRPPLTTVRQDFDALGERAVEALVHGIESGAPGASDILPTSLVVRSSTAPAAR
ncbi:LacI family transcriptional regulator [Microbacterium mangrovi]|uniref:LacI family transcriptional regulator n=2 Tax=Microbacterium mangrovi TaxID=1348253 RepID=A0A0B2A4B5_9MICO|nr:LacI family transcriptional regulator [Microbacterium mangrovi]